MAEFDFVAKNYAKPHVTPLGAVLAILLSATSIAQCAVAGADNDVTQPFSYRNSNREKGSAMLFSCVVAAMRTIFSR